MNVYLGGLYKEVEYIETSGTQWIDTGVIPTQNTKSQIKVLFKEFTGDVVYGMYNSDDNADYRLFNMYSNNTNIGKCIFDFGSQRIISSSVVFSTNTSYELEIGNYYVKNLGTGTNLVSGTAISSYTGSRTITLNYSNNPAISKNRWYYVKIWNGSSLVRDMIPCYRVSDNEIGMFDKVNNQFYANSGTGTFTKGADVGVINSELKNAYIGDYTHFTPGANTMMYLPLTTDTVDHSGNNVEMITVGTVTNTTLNGVKCAYFNNGGMGTSNTLNTTGNWTHSAWFYGVPTGSGDNGVFVKGSERNVSCNQIWSGFRNGGLLGASMSRVGYSNTASVDTSAKWHLYTITRDSGTMYIYYDGVQKITYNISSYEANALNYFSILYTYGGGGAWGKQMYFADWIVENKAWNATEISNYYNATKSNYGL